MAPASMASMAVCTAVAFFLYGIPFRGSLPALAVAAATFLLAALGQGFLISTVTRNQFLASQAALVSAFLPAFILSGFVFEIASMPWIIRTLTGIIPARYHSTRLPGKPLSDIGGKPMIQHVYENALRAAVLDEVIVATDDPRIVKAV